MQPELIADYKCVIGEGPLWHPDEQRVYWVDIDNGRMFRYDPASGHHEQCYQGTPIGGFTIQEDGSLLLFMAQGKVASWRDGQSTTIIPEIPDERGTRFNDAIADPAGRVFCGTSPKGERPARLYRLDADARLTRLLDNVGLSNGMGFSPDRRYLYHTDTPAYKITRYEYEAATGAISNGQVLIEVDPADGYPDGMTVDAEGYLWVARWDGGCLIRYTPEGQEVQRIAFPARKVSSVTFGGPDHSDMYVTTAGGDKKDSDGPGAGALFRLRLGIRGVPEFRSRVALAAQRD